MRKTLVEIYALAVCFFSVACLAITLGLALYDIVEIAAPAFTLNSHDYERHQSDEAFLESGGTKRIVRIENGIREEEVGPEMDGGNLTQRREESYGRALRAEQRGGWQSLVRAAIILFVATIVFAVHWRLAISARRVSGA